MKTLAVETAAWGLDRYHAAWERAARSGVRTVALDTRAAGWRYLSLNALVLSSHEAAQLAELTPRFQRLASWATRRVLEDPDWWTELGWPWPAIELARQEPVWVEDQVTPYGRFDWLLEDLTGTWQLVEFNADTPSGGREVSGLEPLIVALHRRAGHTLHRSTLRFERRLEAALSGRIAAFSRATGRSVRLVGIVSSHAWIEDMAQAWWLATLLRRAGLQTLVGDVNDLRVTARGQTLLRGRAVDALYRFYPLERLYQHGVFAPLMEAVLDRRILLLNGPRGFLAQSKAVLAYLWLHRGELAARDRTLVEQHLPAIVPARYREAAGLLHDSVVKHVNGREGQEVSFGSQLSPAEWEQRLLDGGWMVQRRVRPRAVEDVEVDDTIGKLYVARPRYACVGAFCVGGRYAGLYTRLGGLITRSKSTFVPTVVEGP